ncbi:class A beta-lactamase [Bosea sp. (in: a-proteobacteria)]|uniref:class A beta-lactamase n=1 Tax=Bosea sp. (in: a-proteobacteria) TaxID=1871050 RepID=UPI002FC58370
MIRRRDLLIGSLLAAPVLGRLPALARSREEGVREALFALDRKHGGRLGVAILDSADGNIIAHRGQERFAMCSTFKFVAAAFVLARVDRGEESLDRRVSYSKADLVTYSPVTEKHVDTGLTVAELCDAAVTLSDNAAGNLLLDSFGGPKGLTSYMRSLGDDSSRLDRRELELNEATPGDPRDTTTPVAMAQILRQTVLGAALSPASRHQLTAWLVSNKTGDKRLRAGVPKGWRVGDRTGTGSNNATNDIGVIWPPGRAPLIVTAYYAESRGSFAEREAVLAEVGRLATSF